MRLIDADALIKGITESIIEVSGDSGLAEEAVKCYQAVILKYITTMPTINPEDCREQGEWVTERCNHVQHRLKNPEKWVIHKRSLCGYSNGRKRSNYCPNCGAKMDGEEQLEKVCDTCRFNPPSSFDGKPCSQCSDDYSCWQRKEQDNA